MKVLSVDWDFFFPDLVPFDWGHREDGLFFEMIWSARCNSRNLLTGERALDVVQPDKKLLSRFWSRVVKGRPDHLVIADSHSDLYAMLDAMGGWVTEVVNFDQHHDIQYGKADTENGKAECDNWALFAHEHDLLDNYRLIYPPWREGEPEGRLPWPEWVTVEHGLDGVEPEHYDVVFICRSSAWTPSWSDPDWLRFVGYWRRKYPTLWSVRSTCPFVTKSRSPSLLDAERIAIEHQQAWEAIALLRGSREEAKKVEGATKVAPVSATREEAAWELKHCSPSTPARCSGPSRRR